MAENFNKALGQKLRQTREKLGLTLQQVASKVGFNSYQTLSAIEEGNRQIKASELAKLAKIYVRDISYYLVANKEEKEEPVIVWRNCVENGKTKEKEQRFRKYCLNYYDLEERLGLDHRSSLPLLSELNPDDFSYEKIKEIANDYYNQMQLGSRPACVLEKVLEEKYNIKIVYIDLEDCGSAGSVMGDFGAAIALNSAEAPWRRNFNLAHELFHVITWKILNKDNTYLSGKSVSEQWADAFSSYLLLPQAEVTREFESRTKDGKITILDLVGIAREFEVSTEALLWRLVNLKRLKKSEVEKLMIGVRIKAIDKMQRVNDYKKETLHISIRYINLAFKCYQNGLISRGKLAEYLNVNRSEIDSELMKYGYDEEKIYDQKLAIA